jgi:hypothetical protein
VTATTSMSTQIAAATRKARSKPAVSACWWAAADLDGPGGAARAAAAGRARLASTVQATVPSTARPMEAPVRIVRGQHGQPVQATCAENGADNQQRTRADARHELGGGDRAQLVVFAYQAGLITPRAAG